MKHKDNIVYKIIEEAEEEIFKIYNPHFYKIFLADIILTKHIKLFKDRKKEEKLKIEELINLKITPNKTYKIKIKINKLFNT